VFRGRVSSELRPQILTTKRESQKTANPNQIRLNPPELPNPRSKNPSRTKKDAARMRRPNRQKTRSLGQNYYKSPLVRSPLKTVIIKTFSPARLTFYLCGRINAAPRERRQESAKEQDRGDYHECRQTKQCPVHAPKRFRGILSYKMLFTARCDYLFRHSF